MEGSLFRCNGTTVLFALWIRVTKEISMDQFVVVALIKEHARNCQEILKTGTQIVNLHSTAENVALCSNFTTQT